MCGYGRLLDRAVERGGGIGGPGPEPEADRLARRAGALRAGPRDLVEIHAAAMTARERETGPLRMKLYVAEGRVRLGDPGQQRRLDHHLVKPVDVDELLEVVGRRDGDGA